ncbi:MAG TPA: murein transglycosylase A [Rhizomicrobium sp.]|nr:murein transglycosylase A [Rhizomicrobium sp.]
MKAGRLLASVLLVLLAACAPHPSRPGLHLSRVGFDALPGWADAGPGAALAAFRQSCAVLKAQPDAAPMGGAGYAGTAGDWRGVCMAAQSDDARDFFTRNFTPFAVEGAALFTGYYEPQIRGSRARRGAFQTPVYGLPSDLVRADLGLFIPKLKGEHISGRVVGHALVPYAERAEIDARGVADAPVLFYTDDPVAFFFLQIQGSGRVVFDDGSRARIAYAGENGQPYTAIGRTLVAEGALARENLSLAAIRAWLAANPARAQAVMETNKSYIFFRELPLADPAAGPPGTQGVALTPLASLAVDPRLHALGAPFYVAAEGNDPVHRLMVAQDTGGAIRGAARGDIFFGFGPDAEARAGAIKAPGALYVLLPDSLAARIGDAKDYAP